MKSSTIIIALLLVLGGGYLLTRSNPKVLTANPTNVPMVEVNNPIPQSESPTAADKVKEFIVVGSEMKFDVSEIKVSKGDTVKIIFKNGGKYNHDWVVDEFSARTKVIMPGETEEITFVANQSGTFEYYCSVMQHRKMGMVGKLVVN